MIGVIAHDAGGAELVSSYLRRNPQPFIACLEGPAREVFLRKFGNIEVIPLTEVVTRCDRLISGTSLTSDVEWRALGAAREQGKHAVAVLDHWVNYRQRFVRHGEWRFPNEVWAGDEVSLTLAQAELPEVPVRFVPNPYFLDLRDEIVDVSVPRGAGGARILYVCDPIRDAGLLLHGDERYWGYTEEDAVRYFLKNVDRITTTIEQIIFRPHPKEKPDKYGWIFKEFEYLPVSIEDQISLVEQIAYSDVVVGCATMAMVVALIAKKRVISCIPPGGRIAPLPFSQIELFDLL